MNEYDGGYSRPDGIFDESNRKPTDKYWLIPLGICFIIYFICCGVSISKSSNLAIDVIGASTLHCGKDSPVLDKPYKMFIDQQECSQDVNGCNVNNICVKKCPTGKFDVKECLDSNIEQIKQKLVCDSDETLRKIRRCSDIEREKCVRWYNQPNETFGFCFSNLPQSTDFNLFNSDVKSAVTKMITALICAVIFAIALSAVFIFTLKWSAGCVFWSFIGFTAACFVAAIIGIGYAIGTIKKDAANKEDATTPLIIFLVVVSIFFLVFCAFLYFCRRKIRCGIEIVKESSQAVCSSVSSVAFPILPYISRSFLVIFTLVAVINAMLIMEHSYNVTKNDQFGQDCECSRKYEIGDTCLPEQFNNDCKNSFGEVCTKLYCGLTVQNQAWYGKFLIGIIVFTGMWLVAFIQANTKLILAHVFGNWYWTYNKGDIPSSALPNAVVKILKNHTGTAAFGSLIITICRCLRSILNNKKRDGNQGIAALILAVVAECIRCFAEAILQLIEFVSGKAFVVCAIMGSDFWNSVKGVSKIMLKDIPLVVATEYVGDIILGVCKFLVAVLSTLLFYVLLPSKENDENLMFYSLIFTFLVFIFTFDLASILLTSYDVAIDTLLVCVLQDYTHSRAEKSYFHSDSLNELLIKPQAA